MAMVMSTVHLKGISHDKVVLEYLKSNKAEALEIYFDAPGNNLLRENHEKCFHITPLYSAFKDVYEDDEKSIQWDDHNSFPSETYHFWFSGE